jgi:hypothetical protein
MVMDKFSLTLEPELVEEARQYAGPRGLSRFVNEALRFYLQAVRVREVEAELEKAYGPITEEAKRRVAVLEWPK